MIVTLVITIFIESSILLGYAHWNKKPKLHLLFSGALANLFSQSVLWVFLTFFPHHYLVTLLTMEFFVVGIECLILHFYRSNMLKLNEAFLLSLFMNLASFGIGWFLPV
jgi:hypothetical protein